MMKRFLSPNRGKARYPSHQPTAPKGKNGRRFRPVLETLEDRLAPAAVVVEAANRYSLSPNAADLDSPMVPLFTDFNAGGTYGAIDDAVRVTLDGNDPDAGRGPSSFRMTWDGTGGN